MFLDNFIAWKSLYSVFHDAFREICDLSAWSVRGGHDQMVQILISFLNFHLLQFPKSLEFFKVCR